MADGIEGPFALDPMALWKGSWRVLMEENRMEHGVWIIWNSFHCFPSFLPDSLLYSFRKGPYIDWKKSQILCHWLHGKLAEMMESSGWNSKIFPLPVPSNFLPLHYLVFTCSMGLNLKQIIIVIICTPHHFGWGGGVIDDDGLRSPGGQSLGTQPHWLRDLVDVLLHNKGHILRTPQSVFPRLKFHQTEMEGRDGWPHPPGLQIDGRQVRLPKRGEGAPVGVTEEASGKAWLDQDPPPCLRLGGAQRHVHVGADLLILLLSWGKR